MSVIQDTEVLREWRDSARFWEKHAQTIHLMFAPVTRALIEDACIRQGHKVIDVAGGPGEPSLTIAELVGPSGMVTCTDAIPAMVMDAEKEGNLRSIRKIISNGKMSNLIRETSSLRRRLDRITTGFATHRKRWCQVSRTAFRLRSLDFVRILPFFPIVSIHLATLSFRRNCCEDLGGLAQLELDRD